MSKNSAIKLLILLVVATLVYSVFWFFKVGQLEKQVRNFINENSAYVSSGQISISGFPSSQQLTINDLKFSVPTAFLSEKQVLVKSFVAKTGAFSTDFVVSLDGVTLQDAQGNSFNVEFNNNPEISFSVLEGKLAKFNYKDSGYRILDSNKVAIYTSSSSLFSFNSETESGDKISNKIVVDVKDMQGLDLGDFYKNAFEKKVIEGIKTGEIILGNNAVTDTTATTSATTTTNTNPATGTAIPAPAGSTAPVNSAAPTLAAAPTVVSDTTTANAPAPATDSTTASADATKPADMAAAVSDNDLVKNNFKMEIEYVLTPNKNEQNNQPPSDPTQIQELPVQYTKTVKFSSFEFSNPLYKITINGELTFANDDNLPHGSLAFRVERIDNLISYASSYMKKIAEEKKISPAELATTDVVTTPTENTYPDFLIKMSANLSSVVKEIAAKNAVSKDDIAEFDIRREKNLEFLINETTTREILGKF